MEWFLLPSQSRKVIPRGTHCTISYNRYSETPVIGNLGSLVYCFSFSGLAKGVVGVPPPMSKRRSSVSSSPTVESEAAEGGASSVSKQRAGSISPRARRPSQRGEDGDGAADDFREQLSNVQKTGFFFRGFNEEEIDFLCDFLSHFDFDDGQVIVATGEVASWCGIVLTGLLDAVLEAVMFGGVSQMFLTLEKPNFVARGIILDWT